MKTIEYTHDRYVTPKSEWGEGPWQNEPDKIQWQDEATGLPCLAVRNHFGAWCGYVGVSKGHPLYGGAHDTPDVRVHGGLTFANTCQPHAKGEEGGVVCHTVEPGEDDDVWWFGFDCLHGYDFVPGMAARLRVLPGPPLLPAELSEYKTLDYVRREVTELAAQLAQ